MIQPKIGIWLIIGNVVIVLVVWFVALNIAIIPFVIYYSDSYEWGVAFPFVVTTIIVCWGSMIPPYIRGRLFWEKNEIPNVWNVRIYNIVLFLVSGIFLSNLLLSDII